MTSKEEAWLAKAEDSLYVAEILRDKERYDASVSRAYYSMFYVATAALLHDPGTSFRKHSAVHSAFAQHWILTDKIEREYHRYLTNAFDSRGKADYMTGDSCTDEDAELHIIRAQAFLKRLRDILTQQTP